MAQFSPSPVLQPYVKQFLILESEQGMVNRILPDTSIVIALDQYSGAGSLTDAAYSAGYYDQAHFIKDFKAFTGQAPHDFFKSPPKW